MRKAVVVVLLMLGTSAAVVCGQGASGTPPAAVHEDLMVIYPTPGTGRFEAMYFDNEGHVIEYSLGCVKGRQNDRVPE